MAIKRKLVTQALRLKHADKPLDEDTRDLYVLPKGESGVWIEVGKVAIFITRNAGGNGGVTVDLCRNGDEMETLASASAR